MARKKEVPNGLRALILKHLNEGMAVERVAYIYSIDRTTLRNYIAENFRHENWKWFYK
jgi:hypothetical protein